ncbi:hypothetical protein LPJ66_008396, partial [Kickxella alabastrina]
MPEELTNTSCAMDTSAEIGTKREGSPVHDNVTAAEGTGPTEVEPQPEQKRKKLEHNAGNRNRKPRVVRKSSADETVLDTIDLLLRSTWAEGRAESNSEEAPKAFGWEAGDKQGEADFCRAAPVPAKLAGGAEDECEFEVYVHELTERGVGVATRESTAELREMAAAGKRPWAFAVSFTLRGER